MDLSERTNEVLQAMKQVKESWVASDPEITDIAIYVHFFREGTIAVAAQCPLDRDVAYQVAQIGAVGFSAEALSITFESYHTTLPTSPVTGEEWAHQEMQYLMETRPEECKEKGWVSECLTTMSGDRENHFILHSEPYMITDHQVTWLEGKSISDSEEGVPAGLGYEVIHWALSQPTMNERIESEKEKKTPIGQIAGAIDDPALRQFHVDMACYRSLVERELVTGIVFSATPGSDREKWLTERLGDPDSIRLVETDQS